MSGRILIVDDDQAMCEALAESLESRGFQPTWCTSAAEALLHLTNDELDAVATDLNMSGMSGIELCEWAVTHQPNLPVIVITAFGNFESAVAAIRAGAYDFITKPFDVDQVALTLRRAVEHRTLKEELRRLRLEVEHTRPFEELVGESPAMKKVYDLVSRIADTETSVLISGESGTGKELVARALHRRNTSRQGPFVAINCAAVPETLLESELFGHVKGAFTDAKSSRAGLFVKANGGTLFLDEIAEMPQAIQPKLLRALQERKVRPVGGSEEVSFDVRLICATNRDLEEEVEKGAFREDLYYRINVVRIGVPPLRMRGSDILQLAQTFLGRIAKRMNKAVTGIASPTAQKLLAYDWPGNVRELENCMERAVALTRFDQITVDDLPEKITTFQSSRVMLAANDPSELVSLEELERRYIHRVLQAVAGNKTAAADVLGIDRRTLYRKLKRYDDEDEAPAEE